MVEGELEAGGNDPEFDFEGETGESSLAHRREEDDVPFESSAHGRCTFSASDDFGSPGLTRRL